MPRHWWHNYPCSASGMEQAPFALNMSEWLSTFCFCLFAQFQWWRLMRVLFKTKQSVHSSIWPVCMLQHWVCARLLSTVSQLRLCSFSGKDTLFTQWVKFIPCVFYPTNVQCPASGVILETYGSVIFCKDHGHIITLCFLRLEWFYSSSIRILCVVNYVQHTACNAIPMMVCSAARPSLSMR